MQIDLARPRACQAEPQGSAEALGSAAVFTWSEEKLLELATSLPSLRTIRHQPRYQASSDASHESHCIMMDRSRLEGRDTSRGV